MSSLALLLRPENAGVPGELADAVFHMNGDEPDIALASWKAAGEDYQQ